MKRRAFLISMCGLPAAAQSRQDKGKKVLAEAVEALGGDRFLNMKDRMEYGRAYSFYREQLSGRSFARIYTRYLTRPEPPTVDFFGQRERQSFGKDKEEYATLFTETEGWQITFRGARPIGTEIEERFRDTTKRNIFYILRMRMGEKDMIIEHDGTDVIENIPVNMVTITDAENKAVKVYFHATTKLPVKQEHVRRDEKTRQRFEELCRFSKYRDVQGVQWPFQIERTRDGEKIFEIFSESVVINQNFTEAQFALPGSIKVLPKEK